MAGLIEEMDRHVGLMQQIQQGMKNEHWIYVDRFAETIQWVIDTAYRLEEKL